MLLFDENLAARLVEELADLYPGCTHVAGLGLMAGSDRAIWQYDRDHGLVIVTKDEDFQRFSILYGAPPKVIWIQLGNCSTTVIIRLLRERRDEIARSRWPCRVRDVCPSATAVVSAGRPRPYARRAA